MRCIGLARQGHKQTKWYLIIRITASVWQVVGGMAEARLSEVNKYFEQARQAPHGCKTCFVASDNITGALSVSVQGLKTQTHRSIT
jgi:hypothetical protein